MTTMSFKDADTITKECMKSSEIKSHIETQAIPGPYFAFRDTPTNTGVKERFFERLGQQLGGRLVPTGELPNHIKENIEHFNIELHERSQEKVIQAIANVLKTQCTTTSGSLQLKGRKIQS